MEDTITDIVCTKCGSIHTTIVGTDESSLNRTELVTTLQMWLAMIATNRSVCITILSTRLQSLGTDKEAK